MPEPSAYHQEIADRKRREILEAATTLFVDQGYDRTSLGRIAEAAGVSRSTLFKQFPTKARLFEAMVADFYALGDAPTLPPPGDLAAGLTALGRRYVALQTQPRMVGLFRVVIAEAPRFPELGETQFRLGKQPFFESVRAYLAAEHDAGTAVVPDPTTAATQFLGMVADFAFWPRMLLVGWAPGDAALERSVDEAVATMLARYASY